jgi:hypothetical protein
MVEENPLPMTGLGLHFCSLPSYSLVGILAEVLIESQDGWRDNNKWLSKVIFLLRGIV